MVALSSNSRLIVVESGHAIHFEQPGLVAKSIREVVDAARTAQPSTNNHVDHRLGPERGPWPRFPSCRWAASPSKIKSRPKSN
jgi:hypothetical protein